MDNILNNILQNRDHDQDTILFCSCDTLTEYITQVYKETMFLNIGKWFKQCFVEMIPKFDNKYYYQSQTTLIAIEHLQIQFYPVCYPELEFDKSSQWTCVKCALCDKKVFLKKQENESFNLFMMKVVYTVWFCHVYSYAIDEDDEFYKFNPDWNLCCKRTGKYFQELRDSLRFDRNVLAKAENGVRKLYQWKRYLEFFFILLQVNLPIILENFATHIMNTTDHVLHKQGSKEFGETKRQRKSLLTNYSSEYVIGNKQDDTVKATQQTIRDSRKRKSEIKHKRHNAEEIWNKNFYNDLDMQLLFDKLEYVDIEEATELHQESRDYLKQREELKDNDYKDKFGEVQHANHILAHLTDGRIIVLDEDWFCQHDESNNLTNFTISKQTYNFVLRRPNQKVRLNNNDKKKIKKHVKNVKGMCEIRRIKRYKKKNNELEQFEYIDFHETVQSNNSSKTGEHNFIQHSSFSRYDFIGYDKNGRSHFLSNDWIELNFKSKHKKFYKDIIQLLPDESIQVPDGSSEPQNVLLNINQKDCGEANKYVQDSEPSCLFTSLANAMSFIGHNQLAQKLVEVYYDNFNRSNKGYVTLKDVLDVTKSNKYHNKGEYKFKFNIIKIKKPNAVYLLPPNKLEKNSIYHCVLSNHHAIALCNDKIFDPSLQTNILLNEHNLRSCAQVNNDDLTSSILINVYKYSL